MLQFKPSLNSVVVKAIREREAIKHLEKNGMNSGRYMNHIQNFISNFPQDLSQAVRSSQKEVIAFTLRLLDFKDQEDLKKKAEAFEYYLNNFVLIEEDDFFKTQIKYFPIHQEKYDTAMVIVTWP